MLLLYIVGKSLIKGSDMLNTLENKSALSQNFKFAVCDCLMCQGKSRWQPQNAIKSTGDYQIDALNSGSRWSSTTITYSFFTNGSTYYGAETGVSELMEATKANIRTVLEQLYEPLINVNLVEVADSTNSYGTLRFMYSDDPAYAYAYFPNNFYLEGGDVHLSEYYESDTVNGFSYEPGNHGFMTLIHEIGHAMGLKHPGNYFDGGEAGPYLPYIDDNTTNTVMSYHLTTPAANLMTYDLKTLQYLYGAKAKNPTDTTYSFSKHDKYSTGSENSIASSQSLKILIYDSGGTDTLDFSNLPFSSSGYRFDIRENGIITSQSDYNSASYYSREDPSEGPFYTSSSGTRIAFNTSLENVVNSTSNDYIIPNPAANIFSGYDPNRSTGGDTIEGANNLDTLDLSSYTSSNVTQTQNGNNLVLGLATNGSVTIKDYYAVSEPQRIQIQLGAVIVPEISITDVSVNEGNNATTSANFILSLNSSISQPITVAYGTSDGTALASSDYSATTGVVTFASGETLKTITVNVVGDTLVEPNETFNVNLSSATGATISDSQGVGTILNDDVPTTSPSVSIADVSLTEGNSGVKPFGFVASLSAASGTPVTVNFATGDGTAFAGSDYAVNTGIITFAAGQTLTTVSVNVVGDTLVEANETFSVNLTTPVGAVISDSQGLGTIINDDVATTLPSLSIADVSLTEGNSGNKPFGFVVKLSKTSTSPISVKYTTANGTAFAGSDYLTTTGIVTFAAGQTLRTVSVSVVGDTLVEASETFNLNLSGVVGATLGDSQGIGTIINDDVATTLPSLSIADVSLTEGNSGNKPFGFVVKLSKTSTSPISVKYTTANGTAFAGSDYLTTTGIVTFATGQTLRTVSVSVVGDTLVEASETFNLNLSSATGATISDSQGIGTIVNDDVATTLPSLSIADVALSEGNSGTKPFGFVAKLSKTSTSLISVKYTTANGTAIAGSDYLTTTGIVTFAPGQTLRTVSVSVVGDTLVEVNETFNLNLSGALGATISDSQAIGTIINDDVVTTLPSLSIADVALTEGNSGNKPFGFVVKLSKTSTSPISVKYTTANGTAFAGSDYLTTTGIVTFAAGQTLRTVSVSVVGDTLVEASETFNLNLSGAVGATISASQGLGTIINDDVVTTLPSLSIADVALSEGNSGSKPFAFVAKLSKTSTSPVTVRYTTANGTAIAGSDYLTTTGIVTFAAGQTLRTVSVSVVGDTLVETSETFNLNLSGALGATISDSQAIGTIINDDVVTTLPSLSIADVALTEGNSGNKPFGFVVKLSKTSTSPISVKYTTANGTAFAGSDYLTTTGIVTFAAGQTLRTVSVSVVGDTLVEASETFNLNLSGAVGATISDSQGVGTIINDETGNRSLSISDVFVSEGNSSFKKANFVVKLSLSSSTAVSVKYATANITAFAGSDYALNTGVITFSAGQTVKTLSANVFGDTVVEPNETFSMNLSGAVGATISDGFGLGTIVNDDQKPVKGNLLQDELLGRVKTITGTASSDTFTLGDASGAYYASNGNQDYALLVNFEQSKDLIQLHGSANDYQISKGTLGAEIFLNKTELIGVVVGVNQVDSLSLSFV